jgi:uncharacterized membrane protein YbaN (DUF454 family)
MEKNKSPKETQNWFRILCIISGTFFTGLGILGIFLPVLPTTPFLLLAAMCYAKGSRRLYYWILNNRWFGNYIRNYREKKGIPRKVKFLTITFLWITILLSAIFAIQIPIFRLLLIVIAIAVSVHILSIRSIN